MRSSHYRRGGHPLTQAIDASIDARKTAGHTVSTGDVASDLISTVPAALMLTEFGRLVKSRVRTRLKQRGELVVDTGTWERETDRDVTDTDFKVTMKIKTDHMYAVRDRLRADRAVERFLDRQAARLGRPVTMGEFEKDIDRIYASYGYTGP